MRVHCLPRERRHKDLSIKFFIAQSDRASEGFAKKMRPINGRQTLQITGHEGTSTNVLVPETTGHPQRSCGVHALTGQSHFGMYTILDSRY